MSTRTNVVIKDGYDKLWFYRHSDGYPEGAMPTLQKFIGWVRDGKIRNNAEQAAGWLILIGAVEYQTLPQGLFPEYDKKSYDLRKKFEKYYSDKAIDKGLEFQPKDWKCGAYEPATGVHGNIEYLYIVDLTQKTISCYQNWAEDGTPKGEPLFIDTAETPWEEVDTE